MLIGNNFKDCLEKFYPKTNDETKLQNLNYLYRPLQRRSTLGFGDNTKIGTVSVIESSQPVRVSPDASSIANDPAVILQSISVPVNAPNDNVPVQSLQSFQQETSE